ncbi:Flp pilus assembly protein TadG [Streptacidiphilus sp. MAP12-20]|uniref:hypothetical protein n=1 Tax=Streptacidiphilus sp. MAP12-20 TaxID=3156299 RepID=UPI003511C461
MRTKEIPAPLVPLFLAVAGVRDRARRVSRTDDLGALSLEMALLVACLVIVAGFVVVAITNAVNAHKGGIH